MRDNAFYLGEGEFTKQDESVRKVSSQMKGKYVDSQIADFMKYLQRKTREKFPNGIREEQKIELWRKRSAGEIIHDEFVTGCTDSALVYITLSRAKGIPAIYVETIEEGYLRNPIGPVRGHVFADIYTDTILRSDFSVPEKPYWVSVNPHRDHNWTTFSDTISDTNRSKKVRRYSKYSEMPELKNLEIARGLDFSQLYPDEESDEKIEFRTLEQLISFIKKNCENFLIAKNKRICI